MEELLELLDEEWQEVGEYFISTLPDGCSLINMSIEKNERIGPGQPSYFLNYTLVEDRSGQQMTNKLNALKIKRDLEASKKRRKIESL